MDDTLTTTLIVCIVFGLIFGPLTSRSALRREPVYGGLPAQVLHLIGSILMVSVVPGVLTALILGGGFGVALPVAGSLFVSSILVFFVFGFVEAPHIAADDGEDKHEWTREDAESSGL